VSSTALATQAASYVRRARAGDENAMGMLARIGEEARKGNRRASAAFAVAKDFIDRNPAVPFQLGGEPALIADKGGSIAENAIAPIKKVDYELRKPPMPRGVLDKLFDPEYLALVIVRACQFRHGLAAAAVVLASGPPLTANAIQQLSSTNFEGQEPRAVFYHGVKFSGEDAWLEVAPHLDVPLRRCLAIGQCVGKARGIQAVRMPGSVITAYAPVAGWELGE
jgi:hypothetical protein